MRAAPQLPPGAVREQRQRLRLPARGCCAAPSACRLLHPGAARPPRDSSCRYSGLLFPKMKDADEIPYHYIVAYRQFVYDMVEFYKIYVNRKNKQTKNKPR